MSIESEVAQMKVLHQQVQDLSVQIGTIIGEMSGLTPTQQQTRKRQLDAILLRLNPVVVATGNLGKPPTVTTDVQP